MPHFAGWKPTVAPVRFVLGLVTVGGYKSLMSPAAYFSLYYLSLVWASTFVILVAWAMQSFVRSSFSALWPLKLLRSIGTFSATVAFIPLFTLLMSGFDCGGPDDTFWAAAGFTCYSGGHLAQVVLSGVLTVGFVGLCGLFSLVFYDSNFMSTNLVAKAHGRADLMFLCVKSVLVICVETFPSAFSGQTLVALVVVAGAAWVGSLAYLLPYFDQRWNQFNLAMASAFFFTSACLAVSENYEDTDAAALLYLGLPLSAVLGVFAADLRANWLFRCVPARLSSPYELELKVRYMLHAALWGHPTLKGSAGSGSSGGGGLGGGAGHGGGGGGGGVEALLDEEGAGHEDLAARLKAAREVIPQSVFGEALRIYRLGQARFPASAILHVFVSRFFQLQANRHMQMSHLLQAERHQPPLDVAFVVFEARKKAEDTGGTDGSGEKFSALSRVSYDKYAADARRLVQRAALKQLAFWLELTEQRPDLSLLHSVSSEIHTCNLQAERCFRELFAISGQSTPIMRLYAAFHEHVCCNLEKAGLLEREANRIDELRDKERQQADGASAHVHIMAESHLEVSGDAAASLSIGGQAHNCGAITAANSHTVRLFGFSKLQLERRNFFSLLAPPLADYFERMLRHYMASGEGRISSSYVAFGLSASGALLPVQLSLREMPADDGPPAFVAVVRELRTPDSHILLDSNLCVIGVGALAAEMVELDPALVSASEPGPHIESIVLEWTAVVKELCGPRGATFMLTGQGRARGQHAAAATPASDTSALRTPLSSSLVVGFRAGAAAAGADLSASSGTSGSAFSVASGTSQWSGGSFVKGVLEAHILPATFASTASSAADGMVSAAGGHGGGGHGGGAPREPRHAGFTVCEDQVLAGPPGGMRAEHVSSCNSTFSC